MSIDTEMLWGPTTKSGKALLLGKGKEDREAIASILNIFKKYDIGATWAIVGHLFRDRCDRSDCLTSKNMSIYGYHPEWYHDPYSNCDLDSLHYGKDVVEMILSNSAGQEIGYHSYSHPNFKEIPREMAEDELAQAKGIRQDWGIEMKSFVFPLDKIAHVDLLPKYGFSIFRGGLPRRRKDLSSIHRKVNGAINKIIAPPVDPRYQNDIWEIPSSMPFSDPQFPNSIQFRAKLGLNRAISSNRVFHIYLHPWDLLLYERLKDDLDTFIGYVASKRDDGALRVMTMGEYASSLSESTHHEVIGS